MSINPRRRRSFRRNPIRRRRFRANPIRRRRFRRNPILHAGFMQNTLPSAAIGAAGAVATDYLANMVAPYTASLQSSSPIMVPIVKIGLSLLVGMGVEAMAGDKAGGEAAAGGIIVALYQLASNSLAGGALGNAFGNAGYGYGYGGQYGSGAGMFGNTGMNRYMRGLGNVRRMRRRRNVLNGLGAGPNSQSKFRMMRNGTMRGSLGYIGPARTLARYMSGK